MMDFKIKSNLEIPRIHKDEVITEMLDLNHECFSGVERAPESVFLDQLSVSDYWIAIADGFVVGHAVVSDYPNGKYLWSLAVSPNWRNHGIATELMNRAEQAFPNALFDLHVKYDNPAQMFYFKRGYRVIDHVVGWYGAEAGLHMRKKLK